MLLGIIVLSACTLTDNYNAQAHEQFIALEKAYMHFLADAATTPLNEIDIARDDRELRQRFSEAIELANHVNDSLRVENLTLLEAGYFRIHARLMEQNRAFSPVQLRLYQKQAQQAYQLAIAGECLRAYSNCHAER